MKVRVSYTVNYDKVPDLIQSIMSGCRTALAEASKINIDFAHLEKSARDIFELQSSLDIISSQLEDCLNLSQGYLEAQRKSEIPDEASPDIPSIEEGAHE